MRSPTAYEELRSSRLVVVLPSSRTLQYFKQQCKVKDGESIALYHRYISNNSTYLHYGHLMCDEMKLDENIIWSTKTHEVHGFTGDFRNVEDNIRDILVGNEEKQVVKSVNQWKFCSMENKMLDC